MTLLICLIQKQIILETSEIFSSPAPLIWILLQGLFHHIDAKEWIILTERQDVTGHFSASQN